MCAFRFMTTIDSNDVLKYIARGSDSLVCKIIYFDDVRFGWLVDWLVDSLMQNLVDAGCKIISSHM